MEKQNSMIVFISLKVHLSQVNKTLLTTYKVQSMAYFIPEGHLKNPSGMKGIGLSG